ncbi:MAG: hypothetical protein WBB87_15040, partial [Candidatus Microthrix parvicella]
YLHRIRVPDPSTSQARVRILRDAFRLRDTAKATTAVAAAYGIDASFFTGGWKIDRSPWRP